MPSVHARLRIPSNLDDAFRSAGFEPAAADRGLVFCADGGVTDAWTSVLAELTEAFELTRAAAQTQAPVVYIVAHDDLLGRRGTGKAMVATGLLSAARTAAFEGRKAGIPVNTLAVEEESAPEAVALWAHRLLEPGGPSGELVRLGGAHLGKALP
jgi:hypothetical protein